MTIYMLQIWRSHVTHLIDVSSRFTLTGMIQSCHTYEVVMSHIWWSRVINMKESCHTYKSYVKESCHTHDMNSSYMWHDLTWILHICDMSSSYMWLDFFMCVTWLLHICDMTHPFLWRKRGAPFHLMYTMTPESVAWLFHICDVTPSYVWCDSSISLRVKGGFSVHLMRDMILSYVQHESFLCARRDSFLRAWHDSVTYAKCPRGICNMTPSCVRARTPSHVWHHLINSMRVKRASPSKLWYDLVICATWLFLVCATWLLLMCEAGRLHMCDTIYASPY